MEWDEPLARLIRVSALVYAGRPSMSPPYWRADISRHPLVIVHLVDADGIQQPDPELLIGIVEGLIEKRERVVVVYDLTDAKPDAQRRQLLVTWLRANSEKLSRYVMGSAIVAPTAFHRGILVATLWFVKPKAPLEIFGDRAAAIDWAIAQAERAGLSGSMP
jgi:hypothetical protein